MNHSQYFSIAVVQIQLKLNCALTLFNNQVDIHNKAFKKVE